MAPSNKKSQSELKEWTQKRTVIINKLIRFDDNLHLYDNVGKLVELKERTKKAENLWDEFEETQLKIEFYDSKPEVVTRNEEERVAFENKYFSTISNAKIMIEKWST